MVEHATPRPAISPRCALTPALADSRPCDRRLTCGGFEGRLCRSTRSGSGLRTRAAPRMRICEDWRADTKPAGAEPRPNTPGSSIRVSLAKVEEVGNPTGDLDNENVTVNIRHTKLGIL